MPNTPTLLLERHNGGVWKYSFTPPDGASVEGQVVVTPADSNVERSAALAKIKRAAEALSAAIVKDDDATRS